MYMRARETEFRWATRSVVGLYGPLLHIPAIVLAPVAGN